MRAVCLLLLAAVAACSTDEGKSPGDTDGSPDTDTVDVGGDTDDTDAGTDDTGPHFVPTSFSYAAMYALDGDAAPRTFRITAPTGAFFQVALSDADGETCTLLYLLHDDQFAYVAQADDGDPSTGNAEVLDWLDAHGQSFGWRVAAGGYEPGHVTDPSDRCGDLDLDDLNTVVAGSYTDVYEAALQLGGVDTVFFGNSTTPTEDVLTQLAASSLDEDYVLGGAITLPFALGTAGSTFDSAGVWTDLTDDGTPANDGTNYAFNLADDAFDAATSTPAPGYFQFISGVSVTFKQ